MTASEPWRRRDAWSGGVAHPRGARALVAHWFGAGVWTVLAVPIAVAAVNDGLGTVPSLVRWLLGIFVLATVPIVFRAVRATLRHRRFRDLRMELDPFPGTIGGQVGGTVEIPVRPSALDARVRLMCVHSRLLSTSDGRRRREDVIWSSETAPTPEAAASGSRLSFVFDIPDADLPESEQESDDYHYWAVRVTAAVPGPDLDRTFEVPVYRLDEPLRSSLTAREEPAERSDFERAGVDVSRGARGLEMRYGYLRYGAVAPMLIVFGLTFVAVGVFAFQQVSQLHTVVAGLFGLVFTGIGGFLTLFGVHLATNRLVVEIGAGRVRSVRRVLLVVPLTREERLQDVKAIEVKAAVQQGRGTQATPYYRIRARLPGGRHLTLGDGIRSTYLMERVVELLGNETDAPVVRDGPRAVGEPA